MKRLVLWTSKSLEKLPINSENRRYLAVLLRCGAGGFSKMIKKNPKEYCVEYGCRDKIQNDLDVNRRFILCGY